MEKFISALTFAGDLICVFVWLFFVGDHLKLVWSMIKKKPYKSIRQKLFDDYAKHPANAVFIVVVAVVYTVWFWKLRF